MKTNQYQGIGPLFDITANYHRNNPQSVEANKIAHKFKINSKQRILDVLYPNLK